MVRHIYHVPIELPSLLNTRMHWTKMLRLKNRQKAAVKKYIKDAIVPSLPLIVTITRIGPRELDGDNLQGACKYVRDEIARRVGVDDRSKLYTWVYLQRKGKYRVDIEFTHRNPPQNTQVDTGGSYPLTS